MVFITPHVMKWKFRKFWSFFKSNSKRRLFGLIENKVIWRLYFTVFSVRVKKKKPIQCCCVWTLIITLSIKGHWGMKIRKRFQQEWQRVHYFFLVQGVSQKNRQSDIRSRCLYMQALCADFNLLKNSVCSRSLYFPGSDPRFSLLLSKSSSFATRFFA